MSCSIRVRTLEPFYDSVSPEESQIYDEAMVRAVQEVTTFNPETQMEVWWLPPMDPARCFNTIPMNVDVILNEENLDFDDIKWTELVRELKWRVSEALKATGLLPEDLKPGVFVWIPMYSGFQMGPP